MSLFDDLTDFCRPRVPLAPLTWFRLGGPAEWLVEPRNEEELAVVLHRCRETDTPVRILGLGANLLVSDAGVRGAVVRLSHPRFQRIDVNCTRIEAGGGAHLTKLVRASVNAGLAGLEVLAGIPGTLGGGIRMNCGGRYGDLAASVDHVVIVTRTGELATRSRDDLRFGYRCADLGDDFVVSAALKLNPTDPGPLQERFREIWKYKSEVQPPLEDCSAGCIFKNPAEGASAGKLIDQAGLKGRRCGGAEVSTIHANFIIAHAGARTSDVLRLIEEIEATVERRAGVRLQREVQIW
jgi:UDP-N-acetylmuramate dehydrogenase